MSDPRYRKYIFVGNPKRRPRITVTNPTAHNLKRRINELRQRISAAEETAARLGTPLSATVATDQAELERLQKELERTTKGTT